MKARIKKTGEIVNIADYAKIALDWSDSWGNAIELSPEEIELIDDSIEDNPTDWNQVRIQAAIAVLPSMIDNIWYSLRNGGKLSVESMDKEVSILSVRIADTLVEELKKEKS